MKVITEGVEIIIATPGRLNDLIDAGCIKVESVTFLVLDEVESNFNSFCQDPLSKGRIFTAVGWFKPR